MAEIEIALTPGEETKLYELGYLYSPLVSAEELPVRLAASIKASIDEFSGLVTGELEPRLLKLAYPIGRFVEHKRTVFREAYFGAIRFSLPAEALARLESRLKVEAEILRFLFIALPKGAAKSLTPKRPLARRRQQVSDGERPSQSGAKAKAAMSNEDIDKEIEGLLIE